MTALTQEVKLQGRAFKELNDTLGHADRPHGRRDSRRLSRARARGAARDRAPLPQRGPGALIDVRDRLGRGLESVAVEASGDRRRSSRRLVGSALFCDARHGPAGRKLAALTKGYELGLERWIRRSTDSTPARFRCEGQPSIPGG